MAECSEIEAGGEVRTIKDATARKSLVYSTDEADTGKKWIDGKPIYRKVIEFSRTNQNSFNVAINSSPIVDKFVLIDGYVYGANNLQHGLYHVGDGDQFRYYVSAKNQIVVAVGSSFPAAPFTGYFIVEYTKTSD